MEYFAIVAYARSGSTWLSGALGSHPHIACGGEIFNNNNHYWREWKDQGKSTDLYLSEMIEKGKELGTVNDETKVCGFKILYYHAIQEVDVNSISRELKIIHLKRRRHLMSMTSNLFVDNSKSANVNCPYQNKYVNQNVTIDTKHLENIHYMFNHREKDWAYFDNVFKDYEKIEVWYEDMCLNSELEYRRILDFLEIEQRPLKGTTKIQRTVSLGEAIINYDEASQYLIKAL